jgi:hypothetical protein
VPSCRVLLSTNCSLGIPVLDYFESESETYVTTNGESASLSWNKASIRGLRLDLFYCLIVAGLLIWCALSDERRDLSFAFVVGPSQLIHSQVRIPWDSRQYSTVSDSRLFFSSPPTTRSATEISLITTLHGPNRKHCLQQFLYCCLRIRCRGNLFTEPLRNNGRLIWLHYFGIQAPCYSMKSSVFWDIKPCIPLKVKWCLGEMYSRLLQGSRVRQE